MANEAPKPQPQNGQNDHDAGNRDKRLAHLFRYGQQHAGSSGSQADRDKDADAEHGHHNRMRSDGDELGCLPATLALEALSAPGSEGIEQKGETTR
jgi:hypothetical protein